MLVAQITMRSGRSSPPPKKNRLGGCFRGWHAVRRNRNTIPFVKHNFGVMNLYSLKQKGSHLRRQAPRGNSKFSIFQRLFIFQGLLLMVRKSGVFANIFKVLYIPGACRISEASIFRGKTRKNWGVNPARFRVPRCSTGCFFFSERRNGIFWVRDFFWSPVRWKKPSFLFGVIFRKT